MSAQTISAGIFLVVVILSFPFFHKILVATRDESGVLYTIGMVVCTAVFAGISYGLTNDLHMDDTEFDKERFGYAIMSFSFMLLLVILIFCRDVDPSHFLYDLDNNYKVGEVGEVGEPTTPSLT